MISSTATSEFRKDYTCTDIVSLNIELLRVVAQERLILLNCLCSITNTRIIAARPGASSEPNKSWNEAILLSHTHLHAPLPEWACLLATLASCRNSRRQETYLSSHRACTCGSPWPSMRPCSCTEVQKKRMFPQYLERANSLVLLCIQRVENHD